MLRQLRPAIVSVLVFAVVTGLLFPAVVWGIAHVAFPWQAGGSLLKRDGRVVGSSLIAQEFAGPRYFHPRPSAVAYDAAGSGGANLGPTNPGLVARARRQAEAYRKENGLAAGASLPADAVTSSASGLDPDISPANAALQAPRVAKARSLPVEQVQQLIARHTAGRTGGILGEPRVNVLRLNMALDAIR